MEVDACSLIRLSKYSESVFILLNIIVNSPSGSETLRECVCYRPVSNNNSGTRFFWSRGVRNYSFSYRYAARSIHHQVTNGLAKALPNLESWFSA